MNGPTCRGSSHRSRRRATTDRPAVRTGSSDARTQAYSVLAASFACCSRMATWNQSAIGRMVTPASARIRSQAATAVGERRHLCGSGSVDCLELPANLNRNVGVGSGDGTEDLPPTVGCFDVANANLQMPFTFLAATNERRIRGDGDARCWRYRLGRWDVTKLRADLERVGAQCLGAHANVRRQKMGQHVDGDT